MVGRSQNGPDIGLAKTLLSAGTAACIADMFTFPLDTAKVRLQLQGEGVKKKERGRLAPLKYKGIYGTIRVVAKEEGARSLYNGLTAGLQRQMCFASVRIGSYEEVKKKYKQLFYTDGKGADTLPIKIMSATTTGGMCVLLAQPTDVVKIRMQAQRLGSCRYTGCLDAYRTIAMQEGTKGLWKGTGPNIARNAVINVGEMVTYDIIKSNILAMQLLEDSMPCHFLAACGAGLCATVIASPVDVVKTRYMNSPSGQYKGAIHCALNMYREKGLATFYKGCYPAFVRLSTWNIATFMCYEQIKKLMTTTAEENLSFASQIMMAPVQSCSTDNPRLLEHPEDLYDSMSI